MSNSLLAFRNYDKKDIALFEGLLYYQYISSHNDKYGYYIYDIEEQLQTTLSSKWQDYIKKFYKKTGGNGGIIEFFPMMLTSENYEQLANLFKKLNLNIIRLEQSMYNYNIQKKFMDILSPNILVVSQEHFFGLNNTPAYIIKTLLFKTKYAKRIHKNIDKFFAPIKAIISWLFSPLIIIRSVIQILYSLLINLGSFVQKR